MVDIDEYIVELKKELSGLVSHYGVKGTYQFHEKDNNFIGLFDIDSHGNIVGEIRDPNSLCPKHIVQGKLFLDNLTNHLTMNFVKIPTGTLANIYYHLAKLDKNTQREGNYEGIWAVDDDVVKVDLSGPEPEKKNKTKITLSELTST